MSFTTPYLIGRNNPMMLGVYLRRQFQTSMYYELSAALSVVIPVLLSLRRGLPVYEPEEKEWEKSRLQGHFSMRGVAYELVESGAEIASGDG